MKANRRKSFGNNKSDVVGNEDELGWSNDASRTAGSANTGDRM